jgi:phosphoenolpyruvate phosphomutase
MTFAKRLKMKKTSQLKSLIQGPGLEFLMEAHNGLSAKIVEDAGFKGIWASGLSLSASLGVRDNNEISWTQVVDFAEFINDAVSIPVLLDGDTGHGNFNNMRRFVKKLGNRGIAGVCIEDKLFPKTNSFIRGETQPLADIEEFCGKIKAGLDSKTDDDFQIIARVEALIAGWGIKEALMRAEAYRKAGADGILIHSKKSNPEEIFTFVEEWADRCPVLIVPTKYYSTPTEEFRKRKISMVIWANHLMRSCITSMQGTAKEIFSSQSVIKIEEKVAPLSEVFRLQNDEELKEAEKVYLKEKTPEKTSAIILAATRGVEFKELTEDKPKALLNIQGMPLIQHTLNILEETDIKDISIVRGYKKERFPYTHITYFDNDLFASTGELYSLYLAREKLANFTILSFGDLLFRKFVFNFLLEEKGDILLVVDSAPLKREPHYKGYFVEASNPLAETYIRKDIFLKKITSGVIKPSYQGEWIGLLKSTPRGSQKIKSALEQLANSPNFSTMGIPDLLNHLVETGNPVNVIYVSGHWIDINKLSDLEKSSIF